jgi:hypothetical protein
MSGHIAAWLALMLAVATMVPPAGAAARSVQGGSGETLISGSLPTQTLTHRALDALANQIDTSDAAGALAAPGIAKSLKAKVNAARNALASGETAAADRIVGAFLAEVSAQRGRGIAPSVADALNALASGSAPPTVMAVPVGQAAVVATEIVNSPVLLAIPDGTPIAWVRFGSSAGSSVAQPFGTRRLASVQISAFDSFGQLVTQLGGSARVSIGFEPATSVNSASAGITTLDSGGRAESLATQVTSGADALTATALTTHLSPFVLDALTTVPPWRYTYLAPPEITAITPASISACGGTTIVLTGKGFTNVGAVQVEGSPVRSFTIDSDTQITALTSAAQGGDGPVGASVFDFLTATAIPPEFANLTGLNPNSAEMAAVADPNAPGTPILSYVTSPAAPRITGVTPNQGPTQGAPSAPGQFFQNRPIFIYGCGFSGATAVLFGTTPSPSFELDRDGLIVAVPPTPGAGSVDISVVTPRGTSPIIP